MVENFLSRMDELDIRNEYDTLPHSRETRVEEVFSTLVDLFYDLHRGNGSTNGELKGKALRSFNRFVRDETHYHLERKGWTCNEQGIFERDGREITGLVYRDAKRSIFRGLTSKTIRYIETGKQGQVIGSLRRWVR